MIMDASYYSFANLSNFNFVKKENFKVFKYFTQFSNIWGTLWGVPRPVPQNQYQRHQKPWFFMMYIYLISFSIVLFDNMQQMELYALNLWKQYLSITENFGSAKRIWWKHVDNWIFVWFLAILLLQILLYFVW